MDLLVSDHIVSLGLTFSIALLVAFRAGQAREINSFNLADKVNHLTIDVLKEQIVSQLKILWRVYGDTTPDVNLPTEIHLEEVAQRLFFLNQPIQGLNQIYVDLVNQSTQSPYFVQALEFVLSG